MAESSLKEGLIFAALGFATDAIIKAFFFSGDYGTGMQWLFILIGILIIAGSLAESIHECDQKGVEFAIGYVIGLYFFH